MKIIDLEQGTEDWLNWRKTRICATDSSIIMDKNPWCSRKLLWERKMSLAPTEEENSAMRRGKELEPIAREELYKETGIVFTPLCVEHEEHSWLGCSLDGYSQLNECICEIKCMGEDGHQFAIAGGIKDIYQWQITHQFLVTGCDKCYFASYRPEHIQSLAIIEVFPDYEKMAELFQAERIFYEFNMKQFISPEESKFKLKENNNK